MSVMHCIVLWIQQVERGANRVYQVACVERA